MCFGGSNKAAKEAAAARAETERREAERRANIQTGRGKIDDAFGIFDDNYFAGYKDTVTSDQFGQLDDQYADARGKMLAAMAGRGMLNSSTGLDNMAKLAQQYNDTRVDIGSRALDAANELRARVESNKSDLYGLNDSIADPDALSTQLTGRLSALQAPNAVSPIGQVFASIVDPVIAYNRARANSPGPAYRSPTGGSGKIIG